MHFKPLLDFLQYQQYKCCINKFCCIVAVIIGNVSLYVFLTDKILPTIFKHRLNVRHVAC